MASNDFADRCRIAQECLPDAEYRQRLTALHEDMLAAIAAARSQALEEAAQAAAALLDMQEEAKADQASRDAKGTDDELARLRHWATVSTYNAGIRRCIAAIRALADSPQLLALPKLAIEE